MEKKQSNEYAKETPSDLAALWQEALREYYAAAKLDVTEMKVYTNITDIMRDTDIQRNFEKFRHNGGKVDKLRSVIASNTEVVLSCAQYIAQAASAAFPPSSAILTAFTYVMKASQDVSKDYDKITAFFEEMNSFLERVKMIEKKMPSYEGYKSHLMRVFAAILKICGLTTKATRDGRLKRWGKTILRGGADEELSGASSALENALKRLESATGFATLANTEDIKKDTRETNEDVKSLIGKTDDVAYTVYGMSQTTREMATAMHFSRTEATEFYVQMSAKFDQMMEAQRRAARKQTSLEAPQKGDPGLRKHAAFSLVQRTFASKDDPAIQDRDIEYALVDGTTKWLFEENEFELWREGVSNSPFLWLTGEAGLGKSCIAYSAIRELQRSTASDSKASVAYFYFRDDCRDHFGLKSALSCAITQIARLDAVYCEQVAVEVARIEEDIDWSAPNGVWEEYIAAKFKHDSDSRLFLVLDGLDESRGTREGLLKALEQIVSEKLQIRVMLISRPVWKQHLDRLGHNYQTIHVTKEKIAGDMQLVIDARLKAYSRLHKLRRQVRKRIASSLLDKADSMLYIDHMLRRLNKIHQEKLVLQEIQEMPASLSALYGLLEAEIQSRRTPAQLQTLKKLFTWLAFAQRPLTIEEANDVARLSGQDPLFSIEEEISGRSGRVLEIAGNPNDDRAQSDEEEEAGNSGDELSPLPPVPDDDGNSSALRFENRSLREYFRTIDVDSAGIRTPPNAGHLLILEMSINIIRGVYKEQHQEIGPGLVEYAATAWAQHFRDINLSTASDEDVSRVMNILRLVLTNHNNVAKVFEANCPDEDDDFPYLNMFGWTKERSNPFLHSLGLWVEKAAAMDVPSLGDKTYHWVQKSKASPLQLMAGLARGHVDNWLQCSEPENKSYYFAVAALNMTNLTPKEYIGYLVERARTIKTVANVFSDIEFDATAHRSIAITLREHEHYDEAVEECQESLKKCDNDTDKFRTLVELAKVYGSIAQDAEKGEAGSRAEYERPHRTIWDALDIRPPMERKEICLLVRESLVIRAECERKLGMFDEAVASIEEARRIYPGEIMKGDELGVLATALSVDNERHDEFIDNLQLWSFFERMAWLTHGYDEELHDDPNETFQKAAKLAQKEEYAVKVYEEIIDYLDRRRSSTFMRDQLSMFYSDTYHNLEKAKTLWYKVLNGRIHVDPITGEDDISILSDARLGLSDILYKEFRSSSDSQRKTELLGEMKEVQEQRAGGPLQGFDTFESTTAIVYANMIRKMGSALDFQDILDRTFESCIAALTDTEGWNDQNSLCLLAKVLACVGGLEREAQIAYSAQFSIIDPNVQHEDSDVSDTDSEVPESEVSADEAAETETDSNEDPEQDASSEDELEHQEDSSDGSAGAVDENLRPNAGESSHEWGDIAPGTDFLCSGENEAIKGWTTGPLYLCLVCANVDLCEKCYNKIQQYNKGGSWEFWRTYCGKNHKYIRGPIEGWKGVKDGCMTIGEERTNFMQWLTELKEKRWKEAWKEFWVREEGLEDIL